MVVFHVPFGTLDWLAKPSLRLSSVDSETIGIDYLANPQNHLAYGVMVRRLTATGL